MISKQREPTIANAFLKMALNVCQSQSLLILNLHGVTLIRNSVRIIEVDKRMSDHRHPNHRSLLTGQPEIDQ
jgi:hypothetical protein